MIILDLLRGRRTTKSFDDKHAPIGPPNRTIAILTPAYPPAYRYGGPVKSVAAIVDSLGEDFSFYVVTSAFDATPNQPLDEIRGVDEWTLRGHGHVWYSGSFSPGFRELFRLLRGINPAVIYVNSLFDARFSLRTQVLARVFFRRSTVLLAPRGELSAGALSIRARKKRVFLRLFRAARADQLLMWHASTELEAGDIRRHFPQASRVLVAPPIASVHSSPAIREEIRHGNREAPSARPDRSGAAGVSRRVVFVSRIVEKKNLGRLVQAIGHLDFDVELTVAGPVEDLRYWERCQSSAARWQNGSKMVYAGELLPAEVVDFISQFDLFALPTLGENYGHVVLEAILANTPIIVGRDTPWQRIEDVGGGWLCDPEDVQGLADCVEQYFLLAGDEQQAMRDSLRSLATELLSSSGIEANRCLLAGALMHAADERSRRRSRPHHLG